MKDIRTVTAIVMMGVVAAVLGSVMILDSSNDSLSIQSEKSGIYGHATIIVHDENGNIKAYRQTDNIIVNNGVDMIAQNVFDVAVTNIAITTDITHMAVPRRGHPRDVIPPVNEPEWYGSLQEAEEDLRFDDTSRVLGVVVGDDARAYPASILDRHEVVNDTVGGRRLAVLW